MPQSTRVNLVYRGALGNIGLERAIGNTNKNGKNFREHNAETNLCAQIGQENCIMTLKKPIPFRFF